MTDQEIIKALIDRDQQVTRQFLFKDCLPLFRSIIRHVFDYNVDFDEFVNELYLHLMENDAHRLKQFQGRSSIYMWIKIVAIRFFMSKRDNMIDMQPNRPLSDNGTEKAAEDEEKGMTAKIDMDSLLRQMDNSRYAYVIRRLILEEAEPKTVARELGTNVDNLYNIKRRAIAAMTQIALNEIGRYEKRKRL